MNICGYGQSQSTNPYYEQTKNKAYSLYKKGKIGEALKGYNVARILAGTDKSKNDIIDKDVDSVFKAIDKQKEDAIKSKKKANNTLNSLYYEQAKTMKDNADNIQRNDYPDIAMYYYEAALDILKKIPSNEKIGKDLMYSIYYEKAKSKKDSGDAIYSTDRIKAMNYYDSALKILEKIPSKDTTGKKIMYIIYDIQAKSKKDSGDAIYSTDRVKAMNYYNSALKILAKIPLKDTTVKTIPPKKLSLKK